MRDNVRVLLVDDQPMVLTIGKYLLESAGFGVTIAHDGREACQTIDTLANELSLLVTDIRMGEGPSGWDVARHARGLRGGLPIVYMTADSAGDWETHGVANSMLLRKPFAGPRFLNTVEGLLAS